MCSWMTSEVVVFQPSKVMLLCLCMLYSKSKTGFQYQQLGKNVCRHTDAVNWLLRRYHWAMPQNEYHSSFATCRLRVSGNQMPGRNRHTDCTYRWSDTTSQLSCIFLNASNALFRYLRQYHATTGTHVIGFQGITYKKHHRKRQPWSLHKLLSILDKKKGDGLQQSWNC